MIIVFFPVLFFFTSYPVASKLNIIKRNKKRKVSLKKYNTLPVTCKLNIILSYITCLTIWAHNNGWFSREKGIKQKRRTKEEEGFKWLFLFNFLIYVNLKF